MNYPHGVNGDKAQRKVFLLYEADIKALNKICKIRRNPKRSQSVRMAIQFYYMQLAATDALMKDGKNKKR